MSEESARVPPLRRPPVRQSTVVRSTLEHTVTVFAGTIGQWWPLRPYSAGGDGARDVALEGRPGGGYTGGGFTRGWGHDPGPSHRGRREHPRGDTVTFYAYRLVAPRATFAQDMTDHEAAVMADAPGGPAGVTGGPAGVTGGPAAVTGWLP